MRAAKSKLLMLVVSRNARRNAIGTHPVRRYPNLTLSQEFHQ
jgi:hypothetical protein